MALHVDRRMRVNANAAPKKSVGRRIPEGRALAHQAHRPGRGAACLSWRSAPRTMSWQPRVWIAPAHSSLHLVNHPTNGLGQLAAVHDNNVRRELRREPILTCATDTAAASFIGQAVPSPASLGAFDRPPPHGGDPNLADLDRLRANHDDLTPFCHKPGANE